MDPLDMGANSTSRKQRFVNDTLEPVR
jgi:hypothetical protein